MSKRSNSKTECKPIDVSKPLKLAAHEAFARLVSKGVNQSEAYRNVYPKSRKWKVSALHVKSCELNGKVSGRVHFLQQKAADASIMDITERKRVLTEIARARLHNFGTCGADGFIPDVGPENLNSAGLGEVTTRVEITGEGGKARDTAHITKISLRDPMKAIDLLNKMDGVYVEKHELSGSFVLSSDPELDKAL